MPEEADLEDVDDLSTSGASTVVPDTETAFATLVYVLLRRLAQRVTTDANQITAQHGITVAEAHVLHQLAVRDEPRTLTQLSEIALLSSGGLTKVAQRLGAAGLTERHHPPDDRRAVALSLTPKGLQTAIDVYLAQREWFLERFAEYPDQDRKVLIDALVRALLAVGDNVTTWTPGMWPDPASRWDDVIRRSNGVGKDSVTE